MFLTITKGFIYFSLILFLGTLFTVVTTPEADALACASVLDCPLGESCRGGECVTQEQLDDEAAETDQNIADSVDRFDALQDQLNNSFGDFEVGLPGDSRFTKGSSIFAVANSDTPILDLINLLVNIISVVLVFIGVITIVVAGYLYMTAGGDASQVGTAKSLLVAALLGITLSLAAVLILNTISPQFGEEAVDPKELVN